MKWEGGGGGGGGLTHSSHREFKSHEPKGEIPSKRYPLSRL